MTPDEERHYHLDHLGTPRLITSHQGLEQDRHTYFPYGQEATDPTQNNERMKFTGHERDLHGPSPADDLDYMHSRYCSPNQGRFLSVDRVLGEPGNPQSWNRYLYAQGNPVKYVDPDGNESTFPLLESETSEATSRGHSPTVLSRDDPTNDCRRRKIGPVFFFVALVSIEAPEPTWSARDTRNSTERSLKMKNAPLATADVLREMAMRTALRSGAVLLLIASFTTAYPASAAEAEGSTAKPATDATFCHEELCIPRPDDMHGPQHYLYHPVDSNEGYETVGQPEISHKTWVIPACSGQTWDSGWYKVEPDGATEIVVRSGTDPTDCEIQASTWKRTHWTITCWVTWSSSTQTTYRCQNWNTVFGDAHYAEIAASACPSSGC